MRIRLRGPRAPAEEQSVSGWDAEGETLSFWIPAQQESESTSGLSPSNTSRMRGRIVEMLTTLVVQELHPTTAILSYRLQTFAFLHLSWTSS
ncbi:hypothetical protein VKT23_019888 [Stygiomarasmius scandens]|uniref:Uncharacterized protein n=1 Tax=Marasmiellus scandens TaxID=2682957 RepID=A0ABR1ILN1_9AGAR